MSTPKLTITKPNSRYVNALILLIYTSVIIILAYMHQPSHDEIIAWDISCRSPLAILKAMKYEGHFCLWHFSLYPFAHAGLPCTIGLPLVSCIYMVLAAWVLLYKAPFNIWTKLLMLLFCGSLYSYPVISRCYAMVPLALWLTAYYYPQRMTKPVLYGLCLGFIINTHLYMEGLAIALLIFWFAEAMRQKQFRQIRWGYFTAVCIGLFALAQVIGNFLLPCSPAGNSATPPYLLLCDYFKCYAGSFSLAMFDANCDTGLVIAAMSVFFGIFIGLYIWCLWRKPKVMAIVAIGLVYQMLFAILIYYANWQRIMLSYFILVFGLWIANSKKLKCTLFTLFVLLFSLGYSVYYMGYNIRNSYISSYKDGRKAMEQAARDKFYMSQTPAAHMLAVSFGNDTLPGDRFVDYNHLIQLVSTQRPQSFNVVIATEYFRPVAETPEMKAAIDTICSLGYKSSGPTATPMPTSGIIIYNLRSQ